LIWSPGAREDAQTMSQGVRDMMDRIAVGAVAVAALCFAPAAGAAVTASSVTSPADGAAFEVDLDNPGQITVTGTATAGDPANDMVRIACTYSENPGGPASAIAPPAAVGGLTQTGANTGTFSIQVPIEPFSYYNCRLRAVPAGPLPSDYRPFTGPVARFSGHSTVPANEPPELQDFYQSISGPLGYWDGLSTSDCFVGSTYTYDPVTLGFGQLFGCAWVGDDDPTGTRASLQVDGRDAFLPWEAYNTYNSIAGAEPITGFTRRVDAATGDTRLSASEPIVRCADGTTAYPPTCPAWEDAGVRNQSETVGSHGGRLVRHTDVWTNSGSTARQLDVWYQVDLAGAPQWRFPGEPAYAPRADGDTIAAPPAGPATALVANDPAQADYLHPRGSLTWSSPPTEIRFTASTHLYLHYVRTIAAGGAVAISHAFATDGSQESVDALSADARAAMLPSVAITAPADGATVGSATVTVTGTATDDGPVLVGVNGHAATVAADGTWSVAVPLQRGANTLVATATDTEGNTARAQRTVTLATSGPPPPPPPPPSTPSNQFTFKVKRPKAGQKSIRLTVTVPGPGAIRARLTAKIRRPARTVTLAKARKAARAAGRVPVTLRLTKKSLALLRKRQQLKARASVTFRPTGGTARTKSKRVTVRAARTRR
jgi:hypothetical protein